MKKILIFLLLIITIPFFLALKEDTITVGLEADYRPFNYETTKRGYNAYLLDGKSYVSGYDVFIARKIAKRLNKKLIIKKISWDGLIPALNSKVIDLIIAGMSKTSEREKEISFTIPYYESKVVLVARKDNRINEITNYKDIIDYKIAAQLGTMYEDISKKYFDKSHLTSLSTYNDLILSVKNKVSDFFICEEPIAKDIIKNDNTLKTIPLENIMLNINKVPVNIGVRKDNYKLKNEIDNILSSISDNEKEDEMNKSIVGNISKNKFGEILKNYGPKLLEGLLYTISISIAGTIGGLFLAFLLVFARNIKINKKRDSKIKIFFINILKYFSIAYTTIIRGTPMMVQAMIVFYGFATFMPQKIWTPFNVSLFIVIFNTAAYIAEILRSGLNSLDKGQEEAARALGFSKRQTDFKIIYPQVLKNSWPSIGNEFIVNLKDTSVLMVIGLTDLFAAGKVMASATYKIITSWLIVAFLYLVLTLATTYLIKYLEKKRGVKNNKVKVKNNG